MVFPRLDGAFCSIAAMGVGGNALEGDAMFFESIFEAIGALVVEDVEDGLVSIGFEEVVAGYPSCGDLAGLSGR